LNRRSLRAGASAHLASFDFRIGADASEVESHPLNRRKRVPIRLSKKIVAYFSTTLSFFS
jgi:hypothetical protein